MSFDAIVRNYFTRDRSIRNSLFYETCFTFLKCARGPSPFCLDCQDDGSDETDTDQSGSYISICRQDPTFRCEETGCRSEHETICDVIGCKILTCNSWLDDDLLLQAKLSWNANSNLSLNCWTNLVCLTGHGGQFNVFENIQCPKSKPFQCANSSKYLALSRFVDSFENCFTGDDEQVSNSRSLPDRRYCFRCLTEDKCISIVLAKVGRAGCPVYTVVDKSPRPRGSRPL